MRLPGWILRTGASVLAAAWTLAACSSTPDAVVESRELATAQSGVALVGIPSDYESTAAQSVAELLSDFTSTGRRSFVDDAAYEIELYLQSSGFAQAAASYELVGDRRARILVRAGQQSTIGRIVVDASEGCPIASSELKLYVNGPRTGLFGTGDMLYVAERVARAKGLVEDDLAALGHLNSEVTVGDPGPRDAGGPIDIALTVRAGPRFHVEDVSFALDRTAHALDEAIDEQIRKALERIQGGARSADGRLPYEPRMESKLRSAINDALGSGGYPDASVDVTTSVDIERELVTIKTVATPGPFVQLADVRFNAKGRTDEEFLRSRMKLGKGDRFDSVKVRDSVRALYRTGLFSQVTPELVGAGEARSLVIDIVEQNSIEVSAEPGWGSYELGRLTIGARDRNLFGTGLAASTSATVAVKALRANVSFTDPWFLKRDLIGDLRGEFDRREEPSFTRESRGLGAFVTKEWTRASATTLGYRFRRSEAKDIAVVDNDVVAAQSVLNVSGVVLTQRYDVRDALFAPTKGWYFELTGEIGAEALGSELEFFRSRLSSAWFTALTGDDVLGIGLRAGLIAPAFSETTIPIQERFFAGGENSVRSFMESALGPKDASGEPLGGQAFGTASIEWRRELGWAFQSAVFIDAGFVEEEAGALLSFDDVRTGVGAGLRYLLPIGPLRIDAAVNPDRRAGEDEWVISFGIGMPF